MLGLVADLSRAGGWRQQTLGFWIREKITLCSQEGVTEAQAVNHDEMRDKFGAE